MKRVLAILALLTACTTPSHDWKSAAGPLQSIYAKELDPDAPLPEHPRPQLVRERWRTLNGMWQFQPAVEHEAAPIGRELPEHILVPFPVESQLSGIGRKHERVWYRREFTVPTQWRNERTLLHFGAVDWDARVWVNGVEVAAHRGGYDPFTCDITAVLNSGQTQEVVVGVWDPTDAGDQARGKQVNKPGGIYYTSVTGIWQTVWLESVPKAHITQVSVHGDPRNGNATAMIEAAGDITDLEVELTLRDGVQQVQQAKGRANAALSFTVPNAKAWSPDSPHLYDMDVRLVRRGIVIDQARSYCALRTIAVAQGSGGAARLYLNGAELFQVGPLDQGYWPDGLYTAPTDAALRSDLVRTKELGFNMLRKHVKVEPARFYRHCDELGLLVWQDMPSGNNQSAEGKRQFERELAAMVRWLRPFPSIVCWVVFNEGWGQYDTPRVVAQVQHLDTTRLVSNASGWVDQRVGDLMDIHVYPGPGAPKVEARRAGVLGEFGGIGLPLKGHMWQAENWGYEGAADREALTTRYVDLLAAVHDLKVNAGLAAAVYTQTTDVETETNGLLTYDRAVVKLDAARVRAANQGRFPTLVPLVPTSRVTPVEWKVRFDAPQGEWTAANYEDRGWVTAPGGFGTAGTPGAVVQTTWPTTQIWLRRRFTLDTAPRGLVQLQIHHDEDAQVWLDGMLIADLKGYTSAYKTVTLSAEAQALFTAGEHVLALTCRQTGGGQYIDAGFVMQELTSDHQARGEPKNER